MLIAGISIWAVLVIAAACTGGTIFGWSVVQIISWIVSVHQYRKATKQFEHMLTGLTEHDRTTEL